MTDGQLLVYVQSTAAALDLPLSHERAQRVASHLARTAAMARMLEAFPLTPEDELVEIYQPKPHLKLAK